ncbi:hypothetical protein HB780_20925 [Rhizobium lusitanum]|uniref:hypothetical protein n=1 Tax=Rhizobium lusitanum TaxID=293958 RepID=UPI00161969BC|nr:hypothetical protein [Rhizobium lusitanum]QND48105.1 hypothetical protein HB780_20925 [Rhizobium lusitanum]
MFAVEPYFAERQVAGKWVPCRVVGISSTASELSPRFVVEYVKDGFTALAFEEFIKRRQPGNPL